MLVLSDCPERFAGLVPAGGWSDVPADSLQLSDRALWRGLGMGDTLFRGTGEEPGPPGFWSRALIVAEAPASQFDTLRELLAAGLELPGPIACMALTGRSFHGQRGRPWLAAPGNLHLCAVFPEPGLAAREAGSLPMLPALALLDAVRALTGGAPPAGIKWVNDVLVDGRKIGGVLTATLTQGDRVNALVLGIGLNVATAPPVPPTPFVPSVGCLAETGTNVALADAAACVLAALGGRVTEVAETGPAVLLEAYRDASLVIGREVCIFEDPGQGPTPPEGQLAPILRGRVRGIAADLSLILDGVETPVTRGRLAFADDCCRSCP